MSSGRIRTSRAVVLSYVCVLGLCLIAFPALGMSIYAVVKLSAPPPPPPPPRVIMEAGSGAFVSGEASSGSTR